MWERLKMESRERINRVLDRTGCEAVSSDFSVRRIGKQQQNVPEQNS